MELIGTNQENKDKKTKKIIIGITIAIVVLLIISIILYGIIYYLTQKLFKFNINGEPVIHGEQLAIDGVDAEYKAMCRYCYKNILKDK